MRLTRICKHILLTDQAVVLRIGNASFASIWYLCKFSALK